MRTLFDRGNRFLAAPLGMTPRALLIVATLLLLTAYVAPLWTLSISAPQRPHELRLSIYSYKLGGGNGGQDIDGINVLNHEIGMRDLAAEDFAEFKWMPFVVGALALLFVRCFFIGNVGTLIDVFVLYVYFGLFSLWSFGYKLYIYGHRLIPTAVVKVAPFMPPLVGRARVAEIDVSSSPAAGSYALAATAVILAVALFFGVRETRADEAQDARMAV